MEKLPDWLGDKFESKFRVRDGEGGGEEREKRGGGGRDTRNREKREEGGRERKTDPTPLKKNQTKPKIYNQSFHIINLQKNKIK